CGRGPCGFRALVLAPSGSIEIRPEADDLDRYVSAKPREAITRCMADDLGMPPPKPDAGPAPFADPEGMISNYYTATTATGEFTAQNGGTVASALSAITT